MSRSKARNYKKESKFNLGLFGNFQLNSIYIVKHYTGHSGPW